MGDRFFIRLLYGTLPLLVWAFHFFAVYLLVAAQCSPALMTPQAPRHATLAMLSVLALGACAALLWRARGTLRHAVDDSSALLHWAQAGSAVLAMVGIAWTSVPMLLIDGCG
jgi:hypothetical protein